jgi:hypothetical protein
VNSIRVQAAPNLSREMHVAGRPGTFNLAVDFDVQTSHKFRVAELPDVEVVGFNDPRKRFNICGDLIDGHAHGDCLQENATGGSAKRYGAAQDDDGDDKRDGRVEVVASRECGEPNQQRSHYDANVSQGIAHDMEEDSSHVKVAVRVAVSAMTVTTVRVAVFVVMIVG